MLVWNAGIISTDDALSGFNNPGVLAVGSLFVVIKGVERSKLADKAAKHVFGLQTSFTSGLLRLMSLAFLLSAFLNNTPVVALLIPITKDWASTRGFSPSLLLMPLSFACIFGGLVTIIGTSTNLVVQGLVIEAGQDDPSIEGLGFFEPGLVGLPLGLVGMAYLVIAAPRILPKGRSGMIQYVRDKAEEFLTEVSATKCALFLWGGGEGLGSLLCNRLLTIDPWAYSKLIKSAAAVAFVSWECGGLLICLSESSESQRDGSFRRELSRLRTRRVLTHGRVY